jgi:CBS-domain-containing membrane protein
MAARIAADAAGGAIAVALMELLSARAAYPLMVVPFATSIVLVMGTPDAEPAQPRALIGGHIVSTLVGLVVLNVAGPETWAAAFAVGLAMAAMHATPTRRPVSTRWSW